MLKHETAKHIQYYCILTQQMGKKLNPVSLSWTVCQLFFQIKVTSLFKGKKMGLSKRPAIDHCSIWNSFFFNLHWTTENIFYSRQKSSIYWIWSKSYVNSFYCFKWFYVPTSISEHVISHKHQISQVYKPTSLTDALLYVVARTIRPVPFAARENRGIF